MVGPELIYRHFPDLTPKQKNQFAGLYGVYSNWNAKINVISRKDIDELYIRHVLHSLSIAKFAGFDGVRKVLDIGTGGGFPGIPLAILFPDIRFHLVDSIGKKIQVVQAVSEELGISNVKAEQIRAEMIRDKYDMITCRAVTRLAEFYGWIRKNLNQGAEVVTLKGGDLNEEILEFRKAYPGKKVRQYEITGIFSEPFFETKKVLIVT